MPLTLTWACRRAAPRLRVRSVPPPPCPPRSASCPGWWCRPDPPLAASPLPPLPCPDRRRARPCVPGGCAHPSSSLFAHPHPRGSSILRSTSASCVFDPTAPTAPASVSPGLRPSPAPAKTPRSSPLSPAAPCNRKRRASAKMYVWVHRKDWKRYKKVFSSQVTGTVCTSGKYYLEGNRARVHKFFAKGCRSQRLLALAQLETQANLRRELHRPVYPNDGRCF